MTGFRYASLTETGPKESQAQLLSRRQNKPSINHTISPTTFTEETSGFNGDLVC